MYDSSLFSRGALRKSSGWRGHWTPPGWRAYPQRQPSCPRSSRGLQLQSKYFPFRQGILTFFTNINKQNTIKSKCFCKRNLTSSELELWKWSDFFGSQMKILVGLKIIINFQFCQVYLLIYLLHLLSEGEITDSKTPCSLKISGYLVVLTCSVPVPGPFLLMLAELRGGDHKTRRTENTPVENTFQLNSEIPGRWLLCLISSLNFKIGKELLNHATRQKQKPTWNESKTNGFYKQGQIQILKSCKTVKSNHLLLPHKLHFQARVHFISLPTFNDISLNLGFAVTGAQAQNL